MTVSPAHWNVIALVASPTAWATAAGSSVGDGGVSSVLPYFTNVANRGFVYAMKKKFTDKLESQAKVNEMLPHELGWIKYWQLTHDNGW